MKRAYLKRGTKQLKRTPLKKCSSRQRLIRECDKLMTEIMRLSNKPICQICGNPNCGKLGVFHIFCKGDYPKLRYSRENLLWVGWQPCHMQWHHDAGDKLDRLRARVNQLKPNYRERLKVLNAIAPVLSGMRLEMIKIGLKQELEILRNYPNENTGEYSSSTVNC